MGKILIMCGISKFTFEIPHKMSYPYMERYDFYTTLKFSKLLDLRALTSFWNAPLKHIVIDLEIIMTYGDGINKIIFLWL